MNILIADLDEYASGISEQITRNDKPIPQI